MDRERAAEGVERELVAADVLQNDAEAGIGREVPRLARNHDTQD